VWDGRAMMEHLIQFFSNEYMPHGHCYLWLPSILWINVVSDLLIALAYFSIPVILLTLINKRKDVKFKGIFILFAAFILLCGITHLFSIYTIWHGTYGVHGLSKFITAIVSVATAVALVKSRKAILSIPSTYSLQLALQDAEDANSAKSNFLACMSHEVRTPINGVIGMLDLAIKNEREIDQSKRLQTAKNSANTLLAVINDIIDISKVEAGKLEIEHVAFNVLELLGNTTKGFAFYHSRKGIEVLLDASHIEDEILLGDPGRIGQVINNLMNNAVKFTVKGQVKLTARVERLSDDQGELHCSVADTGIGISEQQMAALFTPFVQADSTTTRKYGGTGLGLAICRQLCRLMGGEVEVQSQLDRGATFSFSLPVGLLAEREANKAPQCIYRESHAGTNVLLVDHNPETLAIVQTYLRRAKYNVISCDHVQAMCSLDRTITMNIDYLLLDGETASVAPVNLLAPFVQSHPALKGVWLLAYDDDTRFRDRQLPQCDYIDKPVLPKELLEALNPASAPVDTASNGIVGVLPMRVLVVEDNEINRSVVEGLLEDYIEHQVFAENGEIALEVLKSVKVDCILMDCQMPVMDGYEATRAIRSGAAGESYRDVPIVAMTANAMDGDRERCLATGMDEYIAKPIDVTLMKQVIGDIARRLGFTGQLKDKSGALPVAQPPLRYPNDLRYIHKDKLPVSGKKNPARMMAIFQSFLLNNRNFLDSLEEAINTENSEMLSALVHNMKGISGNLAMQPLYEKVVKMNVGVRMGREVDQPHFTALAQVFEATVLEVERIVALNKPQ
jgi:two-component system, sensor histidine kinase and response regulator